MKTNNFWNRITIRTVKYRIKSLIEINDNTQAKGCDTANHIKFKNAILKSSLCGYSDVYTLVQGTTSTSIAMRKYDSNACSRNRWMKNIWNFRAIYRMYNGKIRNVEVPASL